ncbi:MAG: AAA family ATPase [Oscillospiraceae bacterium]|nr:AAA family ATPase [Oscillospiraceae bacterium]
MIQPIKQLRVRSLTVRGFKGFSEERSFSFGDMNVITGQNGQGKSSIADAIAFAITGVSFFGGARLDNLYHKNTRDLALELAFADESGAVRILSRTRTDSDMDIFLDGRRITQRDLTIMFGERDLFLSMFNPRYFINVLGSKGRELLERYLPEVPRADIMNGLSSHDRALLEGEDFLSPEAFAQELRKEIAQLERDTIYMQGQYDYQTAQERELSRQLAQKQARHAQIIERIAQLEARRTAGFDGADLKERLAGLYARHDELVREAPASLEEAAAWEEKIQAAAQALEQRRAEAYHSKYAHAMAETQAKVDALRQETVRQKRVLAGLKPGIQCPMCRQTVTEANLPQVKGEFEASIQALCQQGRELVSQLQELQGLDEKAKAVFVQFQADDISAGETALVALKEQRQAALDAIQEENKDRQREIAALRDEIQNLELDLECGMLSPEEGEELRQGTEEAAALSAELSVLSEQSQGVPELESGRLAEKREQIAEKKKLLAALARYISKRVELNFSRLRMNRVAISLYDVVKSTGEVKDVFKFTYEDRPYACLSGSEQIRAGLEVAELVKGLIGVDYPVFIDDAERVPVIDNVRPSGQVFLARVAKGAPLTVQVSGASPAAQAA